MHESAKLVLRSSVSNLIKPLTIRDVQLIIHGWRFILDNVTSTDVNFFKDNVAGIQIAALKWVLETAENNVIFRLQYFHVMAHSVNEDFPVKQLLRTVYCRNRSPLHPFGAFVLNISNMQYANIKWIHGHKSICRKWFSDRGILPL